MPKARREEACFSLGKLGKLWGAPQVWGKHEGSCVGAFSWHVLTTQPACSFPGSSFKYLQSSPPLPALSFLTPLYMKLYHEDGILLLLSERPEKPGLKHPAPLLRYASAHGYQWDSFPLDAPEGSGGGPAPLCRQGFQLMAQHKITLSPSPVTFAGPDIQELLEMVVARSGRGKEAPGDSDSPLCKINCWPLQEVYHCHPRLAASHLSLRLPAVVLPGEPGRAGAHRHPPPPSLHRMLWWS